MKTKAAFLLTTALLFSGESAHAFGKKSFQSTELTGVTESQITHAPDSGKISVMVRGRVAELLFRMIKGEKKEHLGSDALALTKNMTNTHWTVSGKQVTCSKITTKSQAKADYACAFDLSNDGAVVAGVEPFNPALFNLARTNVPDRFFQKGAKTRGLASNGASLYEQSAAYVVYDKGEKAKQAKEAMVVFKGSVAKKLVEVMGQGKDVKPFTMKGAKGWKGRDLACVEAVGASQERCALVLSLEDGAVSKKKNPLF